MLSIIKPPAGPHKQHNQAADFNSKSTTFLDKDYWRSLGAKNLDNILKRKTNNNVAKNVIIFVGDGMGLTTVTAARIYQGQIKNTDGESNSFTFEKFPSVGLSKVKPSTLTIPVK